MLSLLKVAAVLVIAFVVMLATGAFGTAAANRLVCVMR